MQAKQTCGGSPAYLRERLEGEVEGVQLLIILLLLLDAVALGALALCDDLHHHLLLGLWWRSIVLGAIESLALAGTLLREKSAAEVVFARDEVVQLLVLLLGKRASAHASCSSWQPRATHPVGRHKVVSVHLGQRAAQVGENLLVAVVCVACSG